MDILQFYSISICNASLELYNCFLNLPDDNIRVVYKGHNHSLPNRLTALAPVIVMNVVNSGAHRQSQK